MGERDRDIHSTPLYLLTCLSPTTVSNISTVAGFVGVSTICFIGCTSACATTAVAIRPANVYIVVSYRWGVGSKVPGGARTINLLIESVFVASSCEACSIGAPKAAWNFSGEILVRRSSMAATSDRPLSLIKREGPGTW